MNNLCNSYFSSWVWGVGGHMSTGLLIDLGGAFGRTVLRCCWRTVRSTSYLSNVEVGCRRLMSESPFDARLLPGCDQHWSWSGLIIPIFFFFPLSLLFSPYNCPFEGLCFTFLQFFRYGEMAGCWPPFTQKVCFQFSSSATAPVVI